MAKLDITRTNDAVTRLPVVTENPRHRFMLLTYYRHRFLEIAGRHEEIFAPTMMADNPVYHFRALGITARLEGQDQVKGLRPVAKTGECVFYTDDEQLAIGDTMICSIATGYSPKPGAVLLASGFDVDNENAMYLHKAVEEMVWPFDERGRVAGEDVGARSRPGRDQQARSGRCDHHRGSGPAAGAPPHARRECAAQPAHFRFRESAILGR